MYPRFYFCAVSNFHIEILFVAWYKYVIVAGVVSIGNAMSPKLEAVLFTTLVCNELCIPFYFLFAVFHFYLVPCNTV